MEPTHGGSVQSGPEYDSPPINVSGLDYSDPANVDTVLQYLWQQESAVAMNVMADMDAYFAAELLYRGNFIKAVTKAVSQRMRQINRMVGRLSAKLDVYIGNAAVIDGNDAARINEADSLLPGADDQEPPILVMADLPPKVPPDDGTVSIPPGEEPGGINEPPVPPSQPPIGVPIFPPTFPPTSTTFPQPCGYKTLPQPSAIYGMYGFMEVCGSIGVTLATQSGFPQELAEAFVKSTELGWREFGISRQWRFDGDSARPQVATWDNLKNVGIDVPYSVVMPYNPYRYDTMSVWTTEAEIKLDNKVTTPADYDIVTGGVTDYKSLNALSDPSTIAYDTSDDDFAGLPKHS